MAPTQVIFTNGSYSGTVPGDKLHLAKSIYMIVEDLDLEEHTAEIEASDAILKLAVDLLNTDTNNPDALNEFKETHFTIFEFDDYMQVFKLADFMGFVELVNVAFNAMKHNESLEITDEQYKELIEMAKFIDFDVMVDVVKYFTKKYQMFMKNSSFLDSLKPTTNKAVNDFTESEHKAHAEAIKAAHTECNRNTDPISQRPKDEYIDELTSVRGIFNMWSSPDRCEHGDDNNTNPLVMNAIMMEPEEFAQFLGVKMPPKEELDRLLELYKEPIEMILTAPKYEKGTPMWDYYKNKEQEFRAQKEAEAKVLRAQLKEKAEAMKAQQQEAVAAAE